MSSLTKIATGVAAEQTYEKFRALKIEVDDVRALDLYYKLARVGGFDETQATPPAVKGFNLALSTYLVLTGEKEPEYIPTLAPGSIDIVHFPRPFNLFRPAKEAHEDEARYARAHQIGYRMGLWSMGKLSPIIDYIDGQVIEGDEKLLAADEDSNRVLIGRHYTPENVGSQNIGYGDGVFPADVAAVHSYLVTEV